MTKFDIPSEIKLPAGFSGTITTEVLNVTVDHDNTYIEGQIIVEYSQSEGKIKSISYSNDLVSYFALDTDMFMPGGAKYDDLIGIDDLGDPDTGILRSLKHFFFGMRHEIAFVDGDCAGISWHYSHWLIGDHSHGSELIGC